MTFDLSRLCDCRTTKKVVNNKVDCNKLTPDIVIQSETANQVDNRYDVTEERKHNDKLWNCVYVNIDQQVHPSAVLNSQNDHPGDIKNIHIIEN